MHVFFFVFLFFWGFYFLRGHLHLNLHRDVMQSGKIVSKPKYLHCFAAL